MVGEGGTSPPKIKRKQRRQLRLFFYFVKVSTMRTVFVLVLLFSQLLAVLSQTCASSPLGSYSTFNVISFGVCQSESAKK